MTDGVGGDPMPAEELHRFVALVRDADRVVEKPLVLERAASAQAAYCDSTSTRTLFVTASDVEACSGRTARNGWSLDSINVLTRNTPMIPAMATLRRALAWYPARRHCRDCSCLAVLSRRGHVAAAAESDLDAFMQQVLAHRDDNWKKLQQYILDEREDDRSARAGPNASLGRAARLRLVSAGRLLRPKPREGERGGDW